MCAACELLALAGMRHALLLIAAVLPACAASSDRAISGQYNTQSFDSPPVYGPNGELTGASVVEITARDPWGDTFDTGTFHDPTQVGSWSLTVPDGADKVHLVFLERTSDNMDRQAEYVVVGAVTSDLDVGTLYLP